METLLYRIGQIFAFWQELVDKLKGRHRRRRLKRLLLLIATIAYALAIAVIVAGSARWTDVTFFFSVIAFLPPLGWLLPLLVLVPLAILFSRWQLLVHGACLVAVVVFHMGWRWGETLDQPLPQGVRVNLATNNIGSNLGTSPLAFFQLQAADLIVLQESTTTAAPLAASFPDFHFGREGEFAVISRFPIAQLAPVADLEHLGAPVAVRCLIDHPERPFVLYNLHLPTRKNVLGSLFGKGLGREIAEGSWGGVFSSAVRDEFRADLQARYALLERLIGLVDAEALPVLVAGDLNLPPRGRGYRLLASRLQDAFARRGQGYGFTVPGISRSWIGLRGPWLRLDYLWADRRWQVLNAATEPDRACQHRAVAAHLWLPPPAPPATP